jgi:hypothetical protein
MQAWVALLSVPVRTVRKGIDGVEAKSVAWPVMAAASFKSLLLLVPLGLSAATRCWCCLMVSMKGVCQAQGGGGTEGGWHPAAPYAFP